MSVEEPTATEVTFDGKVSFRIRKLPPMEAKALFLEHVRPMIQVALMAPIKSGAETWEYMLAAYSGAPYANYKAIHDAMVREITYSRKDSNEGWLPLANDEENAFQDVDFSYALELDARAFSVNFIESWGVITSRVKAILPALLLLVPKT